MAKWLKQAEKKRRVESDDNPTPEKVRLMPAQPVPASDQDQGEPGIERPTSAGHKEEDAQKLVSDSPTLLAYCPNIGLGIQL